MLLGTVQPIPSEDQKLYIVTESFIPSTACSQYLAVENGDIVEVRYFLRIIDS